MSILDNMNEDCWRLVLDYVPLSDVIQSERVSRRWQRVVLNYLYRIRIGIKKNDSYVDMKYRDIRWLAVREVAPSSFELWCRKLGTSVAVADCINCDHTLWTLGDYCTNVQAVAFTTLGDHLLSVASDDFKKLQKIDFSDSDVSDDSVTKFLVANKDVKQLQLWTNKNFTGKCLNDTSTKLESLVLFNCSALKYAGCLSGADFSRLTELEIHFLPDEIFKHIRNLLAKMPNLVILDVSNNESICEEFFDVVCERPRLEFLSAMFEPTDEDLIMVAIRCRKLRVLMLDSCTSVTGRAVVAACAHAGARLEALGVGCAGVSDDDVEAVVRACPRLRWLDLRWCEELTPALLPRAAAARRALHARHPLRLTVEYTDLYGCEEQHEGLILEEDGPQPEVIKFELSLYKSI